MMMPESVKQRVRCRKRLIRLILLPSESELETLAAALKILQ
jgi:hypothetical protein